VLKNALDILEYQDGGGSVADWTPPDHQTRETGIAVLRKELAATCDELRATATDTATTATAPGNLGAEPIKTKKSGLKRPLAKNNAPSKFQGGGHRFPQPEAEEEEAPQEQALTWPHRWPHKWINSFCCYAGMYLPCACRDKKNVQPR
jgi:hypothetical protein